MARVQPDGELQLGQSMADILVPGLEAQLRHQGFCHSSLVLRDQAGQPPPASPAQARAVPVSRHVE